MTAPFNIKVDPENHTMVEGDGMRNKLIFFFLRNKISYFSLAHLISLQTTFTLALTRNSAYCKCIGSPVGPLGRKLSGLLTPQNKVSLTKVMPLGAAAFLTTLAGMAHTARP